jgi:hypothetical protein
MEAKNGVMWVRYNRSFYSNKILFN